MKPFVKGLIVVEGKEDEAYLTSFLNATIITTRGYTLPEEEMLFIKEASKDNDILCLTDPDDAGISIFEKIKGFLPKTIRICVEIKKCTRGKKNGVAECEKEEILRVLKPHITNKKPKNKSDITAVHLYRLGIMGDSKSKKRREFICKKLNLGICNNKTFLKRINFLNITFNDLEEVVKQYGNK